MNSGPKPKTRLETWKEIAAFFGRTERTVKRWEKERALPVHRLPGAARSRVYAEVIELETWLRSVDVADEAEADLTPPAPDLTEKPVAPSKPLSLSWSGSAVWRAVALIAALLIVSIMASALRAHYSPSRTPPSAGAEAAYLSGLSALDEHGHSGMGRAVASFKQATGLAPAFSEAYVGLANAYLKWPDYGDTSGLSAVEAFAEAQKAAHDALRADPRSGPAQAMLGLSRYYGNWDVTGARRAFKQAVKNDPDNVLTRYPYAHYLLLRGRFPEAQAEINRAFELNPSSGAIKADRALIMAHLGQRNEALKLLSDLTRDEPGFPAAFIYIGDLYYQDGNDEAALRAWDQALGLKGRQNSQSALRAAAEARAKSGHEASLRVWLAHLLSATGEQSYEIAACYAALGQAHDAVTYLKKAIARKDPDLIRLGLDPRFAPIATDPSFKTVRSRFYEGS
jgi:tetratricopeptide (TPR) repeat protein